uniref:NADH-ubiquinone oxidoreductase chain 5 n=1 Tax=Vampyroteuthis infernalis TaxID=55288 RepID=A7BG39_9MOLL|nr:NADH dehydrogenase subunit 5 [Vampyroteuthis infernalis]BAF73642.1 NADH dehydrogenase subunit 5 [Vampyroteuthis infernalis]
MLKLFKLGFIYSMILFVWMFIMFMLFMLMSINNISLIMSWEILSCMSVSIDFELMFDWISCSFSVVICLISGCVMIFSLSYMKEDSSQKRFSMMVMLFVLSMNFFIFIPSFVSLLLGWDGLGLVSFILVIYYQNKKSLSGGMLTVLMNRVGDGFILGGISICINLGHWNVMCIWDYKMVWLVMLFIVVAGMTKSAQIPFSSWLPAAMAAPTPVSALVHSSTLVTAGVFLIIRFYPYLMNYYWFSVGLMYISIMTTLMSGISAIYEFDMKKIIALSTLSQLGMMMMSLSIGTPMLALFHLYTHAMFKALLFMCAGNIIYCNMGKQDMRQMSNMYKLLPFTSMNLNLANMALCGLPFMAGFYSKDLIIEMMMLNNSNFILMILGLLGVCLTVLYSLRFSFFMIWGGVMFDSYYKMNDNDINMMIPMLMLVLGALWSGLILQMFFCQFNVEIFLPKINKMTIILLILMSIMISFGLWDKYCMKIKINLINFINSYMWFLFSLSGYPFIYSSSKLVNFSLKIIDMGWLEMMGGQGGFIFNKIMFFLLEHWVSLVFNINLILFMVIIMFI